MFWKSKTVEEEVPKLKLDKPELTPVLPAYPVKSAFFYKWTLTYKKENGDISEYRWTSRLHSDYNVAEKESQHLIMNISEVVQAAKSDDDIVFIVDIAFRKSKFVSASAHDVQRLDLCNGHYTELKIMPGFGRNMIIEDKDLLSSFLRR